MTKNFRIEKDSMGSIEVPMEALWGAQTQRSIINFSIGEELIPIELIYSLTLIKKAASIANFNLGLIDKRKKDLIVEACTEILDGLHDSQFPLKVWQTGSGTQTNMNVNEVISNIAALKTNSELGSHQPIHPNDDVNKSQSTNDTFPAAIQISVVNEIIKNLVPTIRELTKVLDKKSEEWKDLIKIGRTHFQDAVPLTFGQEISGWSEQLKDAENAIIMSLNELYFLPLGGTAVGTGINCPKGFCEESIKSISDDTNLMFYKSKNNFSIMASHDRLAQVMSQIKILAGALFKISNDIKILSSGPRSGIYELIIPQNEPGSSIMPGKVNPVIAESLTMVCAQVIGNDQTINIAGQSGNFELNVMMPVAAYNLLQSIDLLSTSSNNFALQCIDGLKSTSKGPESVQNGLAICTALAPKIGYDNAAKIAHIASDTGETILEVAKRETNFSHQELVDILNAESMTEPS